MNNIERPLRLLPKQRVGELQLDELWLRDLSVWKYLLLVSIQPNKSRDTSVSLRTATVSVELNSCFLPNTIYWE